jgi:gamma-glutamyltranspeptidase
MQPWQWPHALRLQNPPFADRLAYVSDPSCGHVPTGELLPKGGSTKRRALIDEETKVWHPGPIGGSDRVCLATTDGDNRRMVIGGGATGTIRPSLPTERSSVAEPIP